MKLNYWQQLKSSHNWRVIIRTKRMCSVIDLFILLQQLIFSLFHGSNWFYSYISEIKSYRYNEKAYYITHKIIFFLFISRLINQQDRALIFPYPWPCFHYYFYYYFALSLSLFLTQYLRIITFCIFPFLFASFNIECRVLFYFI
jgi:hypothetical protein